jgi:hypothetical protein
VTLIHLRQRVFLFLAIAMALAACSTAPTITTSQAVSESADASYRKILVIALFSSDESRWSFERELVRQLSEAGVTAAGSISLREKNTPITRTTILAMLEKFDADAVLVTQVASVQSELEMKDMRPEASYKVSPTRYFDVWNVDLREYVEPQEAEVTSALVLATQLYDVSTKEAVWAIESESEIVQDSGNASYYPYIVAEATAIVGEMSTVGLIAQ